MLLNVTVNCLSDSEVEIDEDFDFDQLELVIKPDFKPASQLNSNFFGVQQAHASRVSEQDEYDPSKKSQHYGRILNSSSYKSISKALF